MTIFWATLLVLVCLVAWVLVFFGLPGTWVMVAAAFGYMLLVVPESRLGFGWTVPLVLLGLAGLGELVELVAGSMGVARVGGSRRSGVLALLGSIAGAIVGAILGVPIPVIGPLVAALLFGCLGAMLGAILGELWKGRKLAHTMNVGAGAFWGRLLGTIVKIAIASMMVVTVLLAIAL